MRRWIDLVEGRDAPLYHGTSEASWPLKADMLEARTMHPMGAPEKSFGVSLTRLLSVAKTFGNVVLELDQRRLTQTHRIVPHYYWKMDPRLQHRQGEWDEAEEFVIGPIKPLSRYLTAVRVGPRTLELMRKGVIIGDTKIIFEHPLLVVNERLR